MAKPRVDAREVLSDTDDQIPRRETKSVFKKNQSFGIVLQKDALRDVGAELEDPPEVDEWWFPEKNVILIELPDTADDGGETDGPASH